jgi:GxxExxY protein
VLACELAQRGLRTVSQQPIPVIYGTIRIDVGFRADLIVEDRVIVEIESVEVLAPVHRKQFYAALIKDALLVSSMDWKKNLTQSRKDAKKTSETPGFHALSV